VFEAGKAVVGSAVFINQFNKILQVVIKRYPHMTTLRNIYCVGTGYCAFLEIVKKRK
jgi:hypothetical protein